MREGSEYAHWDWYLTNRGALEEDRIDLIGFCSLDGFCSWLRHDTAWVHGGHGRVSQLETGSLGPVGEVLELEMEAGVKRAPPVQLQR